MDRTADFEARIAQLTAAIESLPEEERPALEALVAETRERHAENTRHIQAARDGLKTLTVTEELNALNLASALEASHGIRDSLRTVDHG